MIATTQLSVAFLGITLEGCPTGVFVTLCEQLSKKAKDLKFCLGTQSTWELVWYVDRLNQTLTMKLQKLPNEPSSMVMVRP